MAPLSEVSYCQHCANHLPSKASNIALPLCKVASRQRTQRGACRQSFCCACGGVQSRKDKGALCGVGEWLRSPEVGFQSCQRNLQRKKKSPLAFCPVALVRSLSASPLTSLTVVLDTPVSNTVRSMGVNMAKELMRVTTCWRNCEWKSQLSFEFWGRFALHAFCRCSFDP